jgi:hypothetical protein
MYKLPPEFELAYSLLISSYPQLIDEELSNLIEEANSTIVPTLLEGLVKVESAGVPQEPTDIGMIGDPYSFILEIKFFKQSLLFKLDEDMPMPPRPP